VPARRVSGDAFARDESGGRTFGRDGAHGSARHAGNAGTPANLAESDADANVRPETSAEKLARNERLERARKMVSEELSLKAQPATATARAPRSASPHEGMAHANPFDEADPFEPFEQCAPAPEAQPPDAEPEFVEAVYSRSAPGRRKASTAADANSEAKASKRPQRSLKGRALGYLSRREYSRAELSRKLVPFVEEADSLETLLDTLEREGWLSNERFVESIVHRRAGRMGASRIVNELKRHAVGDTLIEEVGVKLQQTDLARAHAVWSKKFGQPPTTSAERAKQGRFLAARGFSSGVIVKVLKGGGEDEFDE
jgi:regulatory protein